MEEDRRKNSLWALLLTLLITVGTLALLLRFTLRYEQVPNMPDMTQLAQDSILFGGEFVMLGNTMENLQSDLMDAQASDQSASSEEGDEPDIEADDMEDAGEVNQKTPPLVTQKTESPHKVKEPPKESEPKKSGPTKQNDKVVEKPKAKNNNAEAKETKSKTSTEQKQSTSNATDSKVKNAFGKGNGNGGGQQGSPSGNSSQGILAGKPSIGGLVGYTLEHWAKPVPNSKWSGTVTVRVTVNPRGQVTKATATGATGALASHPEVRRACEQAALKSSFSVPKNTMTEGIGTVTYIWH
jgi:outer membrane biosynthesis protein TonB